MKTLHITLVKKYFDLTDSGEKPEEYREINEYWVARLMQLDKPFEKPQNSIYYDNLMQAFVFNWGYFNSRSESAELLLSNNNVSFKSFDDVKAVNGYGNHRPNWRREFLGIEIRTGRPEWGAEPGKKYFVIKLGEKLDK